MSGLDDDCWKRTHAELDQLCEALGCDRTTLLATATMASNGYDAAFNLLGMLGGDFDGLASKVEELHKSNGLAIKRIDALEKERDNAVAEHKQAHADYRLLHHALETLCDMLRTNRGGLQEKAEAIMAEYTCDRHAAESARRAAQVNAWRGAWEVSERTRVDQVNLIIGLKGALAAAESRQG